MSFNWRLMPFLIVIGLITALAGCSEQKGNTARFDKNFGLLLPGAPTIGTITPSEGPTFGGTEVTIEGTGFRPGAKVLFNRQPATNVQVVSTDKITAVTPPGEEGVATVEVINVDGTKIAVKGGFTYIFFLVNPNMGRPAGGTKVVIEGASFTPGMSVSFGGAAATNVQVFGPTKLECVTPASPLNGGGGEGSVDVTLTSTITTTVLTNGFTYSEWRFENPDNATTSIRSMEATPDGEYVLAVGDKGLVNIYNDTNDRWTYTPIDDSGGSTITEDLKGIYIAGTGTSGGAPYTAFIVGANGFVATKTTGSSSIDWSTGWNTQTLSANDINDVHGVSDQVAYACGDGGSFWKTTDGGTNWNSISSGTTSNLLGIHSFTGPEEVFIVGFSGTVLHYDGTNVTTQSVGSTYGGSTPPAFESVIGFEQVGGGGARIVFAVGATSVIPSSSFTTRSTIIQGTGTAPSYSWSRMDVGSIRRDLVDVWGRDETEIYASGDRSTILSWDDSNNTWVAMPSGSTDVSKNSSEEWDYFAMTGYVDNSTSTPQTKEVWVGGFRGRIMHHIPEGVSGINSPHMWFNETSSVGTSGAINDIHGNAWNNIWAVGANAQVFHGRNLPSNPNVIDWADRKDASFSSEVFHGVWTLGPNATFVCGEDGSGQGIVYFYDGTWNTQTGGTRSGSKVLIIGSPNTTLRDIFAFGPNEVYACGDSGTIYKYNGQQWNQVGSGVTTSNLFGVSGLNSFNEVVCVGSGGEIVSSTNRGTTWSVDTSNTTEDLHSIDHDGSFYDIVGNNGVHVDGFPGFWGPNSVPAFFSGKNLRSIVTNENDDIFVVGEGGFIARYGHPEFEWVEVNQPTTENFTAIAAVDANEIFSATSTGQVFRGHSHWVVQVVRTLTTRDYTHALIMDSNNIWVVASDGSSAVKVGGTWQRQETNIFNRLNHVFAPDLSNDNQVYACGVNGVIIEWNGTDWVTRDSGTTLSLNWMWGPDGDTANVYAFGDNRVIRKVPGTATNTWDTHSVSGGTGVSSDDLMWAEGVSANDIWSVGGWTAAHYDGTGTTWDGAGGSFFAWGRLQNAWRNPTSGKIYAVGTLNLSNEAEIFIYDGTAGGTGSWSNPSSGTGNPLNWVWGAADDDVWAVGDNGTILHWNGTNWTTVSSGTTNDINGIVGAITNTTTGDYEAYAVGDRGTLLKYESTNPGAGWVQEPVSTDLDFFYVTTRNGLVVVTSEFGTVLVR